MLSGEGNENGEKTTIGLISKKETLYVQHTSFVHFFAVVLHDYNVKLPSYTFYGGNVVRLSLLTFFLLPLIFTLVAATKMSPLFFISLCSSLSLFFSLNFAGLLR